MNPMFSPPLHRQRHDFVLDFVKRNKPQKVADLGCGECTLLKKLKFHREIELLVAVDINAAKIKKKMHGLDPLSTDYLQPSYDRLHIELYQGSITQKDARFRGFDLVTCIELIEHLSLTDVEHFCKVVFGYMIPLAVIVSTPNVEFNPLLPGLIGFRNIDHKFEWTRAEFRSWALNVCLEFGYEVEFTGVGQMPSGQQEQVGFCTQIGVFHRLGGRDGCNMLSGDDTEDVFSYTLLYSINYPSLCDNNILRRVLVSEVLYWAEQLKGRWTQQDTGEESGVFALGQTERGGEERLTEQHTEMEELQTDDSIISRSGFACGAQMKDPVEQFGRDEVEDVWTNCQRQQESYMLNRYVPVPLALLWFSCPKVRALSGSLSNLKHLLMDEPEVQLSQDGSALLLNHQEQDVEEEDHNALEDRGYTEASQCFHRDEQDDDWEANLCS